MNKECILSYDEMNQESLLLGDYSGVDKAPGMSSSLSHHHVNCHAIE